MIALWSDGSRERMAHVLAEHGLVNLTPVASWQQALALAAPRSRARRARHRIRFRDRRCRADQRSRTFWASGWSAPRRQSKRAENFIAEVTSLAAGDLVVHVDHGIGRFVGLRAIEAAGAPHDCLEIHYAGGDKLFLPVENIELLSRYGSEGAGRRARPARQRRLAGAQVADEEPHPRDRRRADQDRRRAAVARSAAAHRRARRSTTSSAPAFPTRRPTTSSPRSPPCSTISIPAGRWTG